MNNLIGMLREIDLDKNDKETIKEILDFVANELEKENALPNWHKALLDEIDDVLHCNFDSYETGIDLTQEQKLDIVNDMLDKEYQCWEDIRIIIMNYIKSKLTKEQLKMVEEL